MIPATYVRIANFPCLSFKMHVHVFTEEFLPSNLLVRSTSTFYRYKLISSIFDKCSILEQMHPTKMNVLQMLGIIIWDLPGCGSARGQKKYLGAHFGTFTQRSVHPPAPVLLTKDSPRNFVSYDSQLPYLDF